MKIENAARTLAKRSHDKQRKMYPDYEKEMARRGRFGGRPNKLIVKSENKDTVVKIKKDYR